MEKYDYIIAGGGCAGLSLAIHLLESGLLTQKKLLIVEQEEKRGNDRTWCFWEKEDGLFQSVVSKFWSKLAFYAPDFSTKQLIAPYQYKMIRAADFYAYCQQRLSNEENCRFLRGYLSVASQADHAVLCDIDGTVYETTYLFSSSIPSSFSNYAGITMLQHFKGAIVRSKIPCFTPEEAIMMDFNIPQVDTSFAYVLPLDAYTALVEFTVFGKTILSQAAYNRHLYWYLNNRLNLSDFEIIEEEFGVIPMTDFAFPKQEGRIIYIGTAGGQTKGSSGYTFQFIQRHSADLARALADSGIPLLRSSRWNRRFKFYDDILLKVLADNPSVGVTVFSQMFKHNTMSAILAFLANESSFSAEFRIITSFSPWPFLKALFRKIVSR